MFDSSHALLPGETSALPDAFVEHWSRRLGEQQGPLAFWRAFGLGARAGGLLRVSDPEWIEPTLDRWLGGAAPNRTPLAFTGLGDILYFRDLSARARELGLDEATIREACDVNLLCTRYKRVEVLSHSMSEFLDRLQDADWLEETFAASLFAEAADRLGEPEATQIFGFVPALALGGSETAANLERVSAPEHWDILLQL